MNKLIREVTKLLNDTQQPYEIRNTAKHVEIYLVGVKICTVSHGGAGRDTLRVQSEIRKRMRQL